MGSVALRQRDGREQQTHLETELSRLDGGDVAARAATNDDDVIVCVTHDTIAPHMCLYSHII